MSKIYAESVQGKMMTKKLQNEHSPDSRHRDNALTRRLEFLRAITLFSELNDVELTTILNNLRPREYTRDEIIFRQGDESRELYLVFQGKIRIFKVSSSGNETSLVISGNETSLVIFGQGDVIGEFAARNQEPRNATEKAIGKVTLLALSHDDWHQHLRMMPKLAIAYQRCWYKNCVGQPPMQKLSHNSMLLVVFCTFYFSILPNTDTKSPMIHFVTLLI